MSVKDLIPVGSLPGATAPKTHLERLRDQHSAALSQIKYWQDKAAKLNEEIQTILHRARGIEIGYVVENRDGRAVVDRLNQYWIWGRFLKKDGTPGSRERIIYPAFKVLAKSLEALEGAALPEPKAEGSKS